jgi:hypothetical protein
VWGGVFGWVEGWVGVHDVGSRIEDEVERRVSVVSESKGFVAVVGSGVVVENEVEGRIGARFDVRIRIGSRIENKVEGRIRGYVGCVKVNIRVWVRRGIEDDIKGGCGIGGGESGVEDVSEGWVEVVWVVWVVWVCVVWIVWVVWLV